MDKKKLVVISDSTGETADQIVHSVVVQFDYDDLEIIRYSDADSELKVAEIIEDLNKDCLIFATIVEEKVMKKLVDLAHIKEIEVVDLLDTPLRAAEMFFKQSAKRQVGLTRQLTSNYFEKIDALEFAVKYDDCKDARGLEKADVVIIGVSRTSKTPVSLNLAFKNYKVANVPLVPEVEPPQALFSIDKKKIIGLVIDPKKLNKIRVERLKAMGISDHVEYSDDQRIEEELSYARDIMKRLNCHIIDVSEKTIEETSLLIDQYLKARNV